MIRGILYAELRHLQVQDPDTKYWNLSTEFWDWMEENKIRAKNQCFELENGSTQFGFLFETDADMLAVRLRWVE